MHICHSYAMIGNCQGNFTLKWMHGIAVSSTGGWEMTHALDHESIAHDRTYADTKFYQKLIDTLVLLLSNDRPGSVTCAHTLLLSSQHHLKYDMPVTVGTNCAHIGVFFLRLPFSVFNIEQSAHSSQLSRCGVFRWGASNNNHNMLNTNANQW